MSKPNYRVLFNMDCTHVICSPKESITPEHLDRAIDEVADGGADVYLVNPNGQKVNYPSKVWETLWEGFTPGDYSSIGHPGEGTLESVHHGLMQMLRLSEQCDYLERMLGRCRQKGITPGVTIRMNDMHNASWPDNWLFSRFYKEHPEYHIRKSYIRGWGAKGLDYEHPEVREHYLSLIEEIVTGYDLEVLELDFLRFCNYFDREDPDGHCKTMTGFITEVRGLLDGTGKHIHLIPRVASTPAGAYELGFDVESWAKAGIIDGLGIGMFLNTGWEMPVDEYRRLVGPDVALYAYTDSDAARWDGLPPIQLTTNRELLRGFAAGYLAAGADGIGIFNFGWKPDRGMEPDVFFGGIGEMKDLESIRVKPRRHLITAGNNDPEADLPLQLPVTLDPHPVPDRDGAFVRQFRVLLAAESPGSKVTIDFVFDGRAKTEELWLRVNDRPVGHADRICGDLLAEGPRAGHLCNTGTFRIPNGLIRDGKNVLVLRSESHEELTILGVEVSIE